MYLITLSLRNCSLDSASKLRVKSTCSKDCAINPHVLNTLLILPGHTPQGSAPTFSQAMQPLEVREGTPEMKFQCQVEGEPKPEVEWYKDDQLLEESDRLRFERKNNECFLCIRNVNPGDEAEYKILARNPVGTATSVAELIVVEPISKPEMIEPMKDVEVKAGEDGCFRVRVKGNVKVDWYKGEELLEDVGHVVIVDEEDGETFTLALEEASAEDSGMYKCVASNKAGTVSCSASLKVTGESAKKKPTSTDAKSSKHKISGTPGDGLEPLEEIVGKSLELLVEGTNLFSPHFSGFSLI